MLPPPHKTVTVAGLTYVVAGRYERLITVGGRHFAALGSDSRGYTLFELDRSQVTDSPVHSIGRGTDRARDTKELSAMIQQLVLTGTRLPPDPASLHSLPAPADP